jgi:acyl-coenzyme A thioesterase PaaI-like protein
VSFVRPIRHDTGRILATAEVVHRGRRVATAEATLTVETDGRLLGHRGTTCLVLGE